MASDSKLNYLNGSSENGDSIQFNDIDTSGSAGTEDAVPEVEHIKATMSMKKRYITAVVLFFVNVLNYTDRYTIAGT